MKKTYVLFLFCAIIQLIVAQNKYVVISDTADSNSITKKIFQIKEVEINARIKDLNIRSGSTGLDIDLKQIKLLPKLVGEVDPFKALQYLGGVSQAGEANSGLYVRGGNNDQNLILLNGTLIQNPTHVFGMFSVFNPDLIGQMRFIKSGMPAEYGGKLSSIVEVNTSNIIPEKIQIDGSIGLISSRISTQIPIGSKLSLFASWRGSYISSLILPALQHAGIDTLLTQNKYEYWDTNFGFTYKLSSKSTLSAHFYNGKDDMKIQELRKYNMKENATFWENTASGVQLNHIFNNNWSLNQQVNYSKFLIKSGLEWYNSIQQLQSNYELFNYKADVLHIINQHKIKFGTELSYNKAVPFFVRTDSIIPVESSNQNNNIKSSLISLYARDEWTIDKIQLNIGLRANSYTQYGPFIDYVNPNETKFHSNDVVKQYTGIEPRFFARYLINKESSIKLSATRHLQYINQVPVFSFGIPADLQVPASINVSPQGSWHFSGGYFKNFNNNDWETSVEVYYKTLENQLEFKSGIASTFTNEAIEKNLYKGIGWTYGAEWKIRKNFGKFTGWISYNLAWNYRKFNELNNGNPFLARNDRRHDISIIGMYKLNEKWNFSSVFVYATGNRINLPLSWYVIDNKYILEYGNYNAFQMPAYHRLDLSANCKLKPWHGLQSELNFSVYNVYSRANPFGINFLAKNQEFKMSYLLPVIPSLSWTFHL